MSTRCNIVITDDKTPDLFIYHHYDGYEIDTDYKTLCGLIDYLRYCILQSIPEYAAAKWG